MFFALFLIILVGVVTPTSSRSLNAFCLINRNTMVLCV